MMDTTLKYRVTGTALFFCLIMLLVMTILGISSMSTSQLEMVMAVNKQLSELSFADAELTVSVGESDVIDNYNGAPIFDWSAVTTDGYYYNDEDTPDNQKIQKFMPTGIQFADGGYTTWDSGQGYQSVGTGQYTIEYLGPYTTEGSSAVMGAGVVSNRRYLYRVTGLSVSSKGGVRIIQTILATTD